MDQMFKLKFSVMLLGKILIAIGCLLGVIAILLGLFNKQLPFNHESIAVVGILILIAWVISGICSYWGLIKETSIKLSIKKVEKILIPVGIFFFLIGRLPSQILALAFAGVIMAILGVIFIVIYREPRMKRPGGNEAKN